MGVAKGETTLLFKSNIYMDKVYNYGPFFWLFQGSAENMSKIAEVSSVLQSCTINFMW